MRKTIKLVMCSILLTALVFSCSEKELTIPNKKNDKSFNIQLYEKLKESALFVECCDNFNFKNKPNVKDGFAKLTNLRDKYERYFLVQYIIKYNKEENNNKSGKIKLALRKFSTSVNKSNVNKVTIEGDFSTGMYTFIREIKDAYEESGVESSALFSHLYDVDDSLASLFLSYNIGYFRNVDNYIDDLIKIFDDNGVYTYDRSSILFSFASNFISAIEQCQKDKENETGDTGTGTGGTGTGGTGTGGTGTATPGAPSIKEDTTFTNSKASCMKARLCTSDYSSGLIADRLLRGFHKTNSQIDVLFKVDNLDGANGKTRYNETTKKMEIIIDRDRLNAKGIELARTFLHECFHAYIFGKIYDSELHTGLCKEPYFKDDFRKYKEMYTHKQFFEDEIITLQEMGLNTTEEYVGEDQHNWMADMYIGFMVAGLKEFIQSEPYYDKYIKGLEGCGDWFGLDTFLECLAWGGLKDTDAWSDFESEDNEMYQKYKILMDHFKAPLSDLPQIPDCNN